MLRGWSCIFFFFSHAYIRLALPFVLVYIPKSWKSI
jgi:hypothetical protein